MSSIRASGSESEAVVDYNRGMAIDMQVLARTGAEARLTQLRAEIAEIERAFPGIGGARVAAHVKPRIMASFP